VNVALGVVGVVWNARGEHSGVRII